MRYIPLLLLCFFGLNLTACAQKTTVQKATTKKSSKKASSPKLAPTEAGPVFTFERTPCFGTCPGYVMQVYADGRVAYEGRRAVPLMGKQDLKMPASAVADLLRQAQAAHFEQFEEKYSRNTSDLPSTVIAIRQPSGKFKTVVVEEGAPDNVRQLFAAFSNQLDAIAQLNGVDR